MAALSILDIGLSRGKSEILRQVSIDVPQGRVVALLGPSGSGKTALLRTVAGLARPRRGKITVGERTVFDAATRTDVAAHQRDIGLLFQTDALSPHRTAFENVAFYAKLAGADRHIKRHADEALTRVGALEFANRRPAELSAFERRRVALARVLVGEPSAMLLDEPLGDLEGEPRAKARAWLRQFLTATALQTGVLLATRDPIEAMAVADHVVVLNNGTVEQAGAPAEIYREPATPFVAELTGPSNRFEGILVQNTGASAVIEVMGALIGGITQTRASAGTPATGIIRVEHTHIGGGPGTNRLSMRLAAQMYLGERWEFLFVRDGLTVRAYASTPLRHETYHVEFPAEATWIY